MPRLCGILECRLIRKRPTKFLGENAIQVRQALTASVVKAPRSTSNTGRELSALRCLVLIRIDASVVNENHGVQQLHRLIVAIDLDRTEANRFQADIDADAVADTRNVF